MKKPLNYYGFAFEKPGSSLDKKYKKTKKGKKEVQKEKKYNKKLQKELKKKGFDRSETWNLDITIISFALPRLKYLRKNLHGHPADISFNEWKEILDIIIKGFELQLKDDILNNKEYEYIQRGNTLFGTWLFHLWD